jgi:hypothetical protein
MRRESAEYSRWGYSRRNENPRQLILNFILNATDAGVLDVLDLGVAFLERVLPDFQRQHSADLRRWSVQLAAADALNEIDIRLRGAGTIYRVTDGAIIVSTDDFTHEEIVVPAIQVLEEPGFENSLREFHDALDAYRKGELDNVLTKANHAFESTMKIIAGKMGWPYDNKLTAAPMLDLLVANGLLPAMRDGALKAMIAMIKSDVPTLRNKIPGAGHGAGEKPAVIAEEFATYAISAAAANIRFLVDSYKAKRPKKGKA